MVFGRFRYNRKNEEEQNKKNKINGISIYSFEDIVPKDIGKKENIYYQDIKEHFDDLFPGRKIGHYSDPRNDNSVANISILFPQEADDFYVLYTTGMSSMEMAIPDELIEEYPEFKRAELFMLLPYDWDIDDMLSHDPEENNFWPLKLLLTLASFPHHYGTWFGPGHTIGITPDYAPFAENTKLCSAMFVALGDDICVIQAKDNTEISAYLVLPIYKEETEYKISKGYDAFLDRYTEIFNEDDGRQWIVRINRQNVCSDEK